MRAYDIEILPTDTHTGNELQGWCFGLPPGITPEQWPLDPATGYPLMHGFTLLLPENYRVHGHDIVALSFFGLSPDQNDGGPIQVPGISAQVLSPAEQPPDDPHLLPFWRTGRNAHPRLHRMKDLLGGAYALILLTQAEFDGAICLPPPLPRDNPLLAQTRVPDWLSQGSAASFLAGMKAGDYLFGIFGGLPKVGHGQRYALRWSARANDPNAGIAPDENGQGGYQKTYYWENGEITTENYREYEWSKDHRPNHIGGTVRPVQRIPDISAFNIGFEEYFGGFNFGSGNAQLDFRDMKIDWAC